MFFDISTDLTDEDIIQMIRVGFQWSQENNKGCACSITGYGKDPRGLFEIPEVIKFCQRLLKLGFISVLEPIFLIDSNGGSVREEMPFGAFEIWATAHKLFSIDPANYGNLSLTQELMQRFIVALNESNIKIERLLNLGVRDGQNRHEGIKK